MSSNKSRRDIRAVVSLRARYRSPTTFEYANEACADVSVGGMFIKSANPAPTGTLLKLECETDGGAPDTLIKGVARVIWLRAEANEHGPSGMGVKFVKLEAGSRELIERLVERFAEAGIEAAKIASQAPEQRTAASRGKPPSVRAAPSPTAVETAPDPAEPLAEAGAASPGAELTKSPTERLGPAASKIGAEPTRARAAEVGPTADRASPRPSGSVRPTGKKSRFGLRIWLLVAALVLIAIALADRSSLVPQETAPPSKPAAGPKPATPVEPAAAPSGLAANVAAPSNAKPEQAEAAKLEAPAAAAEPPAPAEAPPATERAAEPPTAAKPASEAAANDGTQAPPISPSAVSPLATGALPPPLAAPEADQPTYVVDFVSRPDAAFVTIDDQTHLTTPATLNFGAMPKRIKITARKPGYRSSSIWLERAGFELKDGVQRRRVYLTLKPESAPP